MQRSSTDKEFHAVGPTTENASQTFVCSWYNVVLTQRRAQSIVRTDLTEFVQILPRCKYR